MKKYIVLLLIPAFILSNAKAKKFIPTDPNAKGDNKSVLKADSESTAYCAIGTHKGLREQGVIIDKGGIAGIGKVEEPNANLPKSRFAAIDIYKTTEITIGSNWVKILSTHPLGSYKIEHKKHYIKKLVITDPDKFWSVSKYLVIEVSSVY